MSNLKSLGKGELVRRINRLVELNQMAQRELQTWINGVVMFAARVKMLNPNDESLQGLDSSTMKLVDEWIEKHK